MANCGGGNQALRVTMNGIYYTESYSQFKSGERSAYTYLCLQINFAKFEAFQNVSCADLSNSLYLCHARK